jgi:D-arginine dehydrogenase
MDYDDDLAALYGEDNGDYTPTMACLEPDAADMDVNAIWQAMTKVARHNGAEMLNNVELLKATYNNHANNSPRWNLNLKNKIKSVDGIIQQDEVSITTNLVVNASGAWADYTNQTLGAKKHSTQPKLRTIIQFLPNEYEQIDPNGDNGDNGENGDNKDSTQNKISNFDNWPSVFDMEDRFYYKPDAGRVLASPCDEINVDPADVQPDELTVAICAERLKQASFFNPKNIIHKWSGLRSFSPDREFVLGFDGGNPGSKFSNQDGFGKDLIHITNLGGYGIQTAMGNAVCIAGLYHNGQFPEKIIKLGLEPSAICPARF